MDNQLTPCPEPMKGAESGKSTAGNHFMQANGHVMQSLNFTTALKDFYSLDELSLPEDECFVLSEEYVMMEEEYVMWNEDYTPRGNKSTGSASHCFDEGELSFPLEESNPYLQSFQA